MTNTVQINNLLKLLETIEKKGNINYPAFLRYFIKAFIFPFFFFYFQTFINAQFLTVSGKVFDAANQKILAYTNIQLKNSNIGTISDKNGKFYLKIPQKYSKNIIQFSFIGYKTKSLTIKQIKKNTNIYLKPEDKQIGEIIIMPDSALLTLLSKAYKKIPENYPAKPTKIRGFYREYIKIPQKNYLYFAEAVIETYKTSYKNSSANGQVRIIKSLVNEFPDISSLYSRFYGGVFDADAGDIVKRRYAFINPKYFKNYHYTLYKTTKYQGKDVYVINFDTKNDSLKGTRKGKFYIAKNSLAYIGFEYESTSRGLKSYNKENIGIKAVKYINKVRYDFYKNKWHYKYSRSKRLFYENKNLYEIVSEYISNQIFTDTVKAIPFKDRINYGDIFSEKAKNYVSDNYWQEYNILKKDSALKKQLIQLYDTTKSKEVLNRKTKYVKNNKLKKILSQFNFIYGASFYPFNTEQANYSINYNNLIEFSESLNKINYNIALLFQFNYQLNYRWEYTFAINSSFGNNLKTESYETGAAYNILLNKKTNPLILKLGLLYAYNKFIRYFSTYQNSKEFEFGNKTIDANQLKFGIGNSSHNIKAMISLEYKLEKRTWLFFGGGYFFPVKQNEKLFLEEDSGNVFTRKNANIPLNSPLLKVGYNGKQTTKSYVDFNNYSINLGLLIKF